MKKQEKDLTAITDRIFDNLQKGNFTKEEQRKIAYRLNWRVKKLFPANVVTKKKKNAKK